MSRDSTLYIPSEIDEELSQLPYEDREVQGAFLFEDRDRYKNENHAEDTFVASYVFTGVGDLVSVKGDQGQIESLERLRQQTEFDYRMFHSHPLEAERRGFGEPDRFSSHDMSSTKKRQRRVNNRNYYDVLVAPNEARNGAKYLPLDPKVNVQVVGNWEEDDGTSWKDVEREIDQAWNRVNGDIIDPF